MPSGTGSLPPSGESLMAPLPSPDPRPPPRGGPHRPLLGSRTRPSEDPCPKDGSSRSSNDRVLRIAKLIAAIGVGLGGLASLINALLG